MVFQSQRQLLFVALLTCLACRAAAQPYLTARIGDVAKATTDFDLTVTGDTTGLVESILGTDEKPILKSGVTGNTVSSAASFDEWFADPLDIIDGTSGRSTMISRTWELADESGGIYSYNGNADETYPIDGDGVGDEGDAHNFFYTVRIKTFITRTAGHVFTLSSAGGDAWMFINNRLALDSSGITTLRTRLLDFDDFASANGIGEGARVPVHIFYAHRSRNIAPVLGVEISAPVTCNAATAGQQRPVFPFATGTGGNTLLDGAVSIGTPNRLDLIRSGEPQVSSAAWHANRLHMRSGFVHDFRFRITPDSGTAEGFAWVMNADSNTARGLETFNLAYNDIPNSLAVEFDTNQNSLASDPNSNHISVHTEYDDPNSAVESSSIGRTASLLVDLADGADHTARIEYTAPDGATSGSIAVSVDGFVRVNAIIDTAGMKRAFPNGYAYFGFTGSSSSSTGSVRIDNWQAWHVPAAAVRTTTSPAIPASVMANDAFSAASSVLLLATDACGARIEDSLDTSVVASFSGTERVTDMGDGSYNIEFYDTVAEAHTLALSVNNEALSDSPFDIEVTAAATSAAHSIYSSASSLSEIVVGNSQLLTVVARDRFSNNRTVFGEQFTVQFSNTAPFALLASGTYDFIVRTFVAGDVQLYVRFKGVDIAGSPLPGGVSVSPGAPSPSTSTASGSGLQSAVAGQPATFYVTPYDAYSNRVVEDSSPTISARMTHADSGVSTVSEDSVTWDDGLKQYAVTYTPTVSGLYTYVVRLDFIVVVENAPSQRLNVVPGAFNATESELSLDFTGTVGLLQEVNIETKDAQGNSRTSALATKGRLQARVVFDSTTINVLCDPASAEPANALSAQCVYSAAGVYRLTFDPIESVSHTISVRDTAESNELVGASSEFVSVAAGAVSISDSFITIVDLEAVAGVGQTFRITAQDEHLNVRVSNDDSSIFQVTARLSTDSTVVAATSTADNNGSGEYVVTWTPTVAGDYDISVTVAGQHVNGSPEDGASCVPASTSATGTLVFGQGLSGGVTGETATFTIEARDEFSNPQPTSPVDQFVVTFAATPAFTFNEVVTPLTNGQYSVTYDVPTLTSERTSFTITIDINGGAQVLSKTAQIADSGDSSAAVASGAGLTASVAGQQASFTITDPVPSATTTFSVTIEGNGGEAVPNDRIAVTPEGSGVYTVQYQPRLSGNYTIRIFKDGAVETAESIAGLPTMVCSPGPINHLKSIVSGLPAVIEAGTTYTYTVRARDSEGNNLEEGGLTINTTWTPSGDRPTTVNVIDNNDGTYSVELTPEKAAEFLSVQNNEGGTPIGPQYKVVLTPTSASADNSDYDQTFEVVAGETARIVRLSIKDRFGNAVDSGGSGTFAIDLEENDGLVPTFEYVGEGLFDVVVTPQASSGQQLNLTVTVGGDPISNSPAQVTVRPSDPDSTQSFVTGMDDATVGDPMAIELNVRDAFNNSWLDNRFLVRVIITDVDLGEESDLLFETGELFDGRYSITSPEYVKATSYSFEFIVNGLALTPTGLRNITVAPAPADASKTTFEPLATTELPVGGTFSLTIEARDLYSNLRGTGGDAITFAFYTNDDDVCTESASEAQSGTFTTDVTDHGNGTYLLEWSTEQAGAWRTVVSLNGAPIRVCSSSLEFNVAPGAASGAHSTLTAQAAVAVGTVQTVSLIMRDRFCNEVGSGGQTVLVGTAPVSATAGSQCAEDTDWLTLANGANVTSTTDHEDGTFTILYTATKAGEFDLVVTVNGELVRDSVLEPVCPDSTAEIDVCRTVTITPGYVYTFTTPDASHETTRAALERSYEIESLDIYDNTATNTEHSYKVSFTRNTTRSTTYAESEGVEYSFDIATQSVAGFHAVPYVSSWSGSFDVEITLDDPANQNRDRARTQYSYTLDVAPATCRAADASTTYRCPNGTCVASYDDCVEASVVSCNVSIGQVSCPEGCAAGCACPDGSVACEANGGYCVEDASECPRSAWDVCPASMPHRCTDSEAQECRASAADCPSRPVCPPGTTLCPDAKSCAYDSERCFSPIHDNADACGGLAPVRCASGACVASSADCPTPITCRNAAHVVCPDGSCRATPDECPSIAPCTGAAAVRCPDGSCRASEDLCPSDVVCPLGWLRCGGRGTECARSVSECSGVEAECGADTVRCSDGTCRPNVLLCPSRVSCSADTPVQCADGTCVASAAFCSSPVACPAARPLRCPSGACGIDADDCATLPSCPSDRPTLCPDLSCAETPGDCDPSRVCPAARPYRCADGTCVADSSWCPTYAPCPPLMPVRCASSECAVSIQDCPSESLIACEATQVRCPDGSCALHVSLCPSQIACQGSTRRCRDGTCRTSCDGIDESDSKRLVECLPGQIKCPLVHTGVSCASSLADCPSSTVCPTSLPFKCADASCAASPAECPPSQTSLDGAGACPGGTFEGSAANCGTRVTCPADYPVKCYDESCRKVPEDCPTMPACPASIPFLCQDGSCVGSLLSCRSSRSCNADRPVKCPWYNSARGCVANVDECLDIAEEVEGVNGECPDGATRCRSGECRALRSECAELECPHHLPFRCSGGACARSEAECPLENGCPYHSPNKCYDGSCSTECATPVNCSLSDAGEFRYRCPDGACASALSNCRAASGCTEEIRGFPSVRCHDKQCGTGDDCVSGSSTFNKCPVHTPIRCSDGRCAASSRDCPRIPVRGSCNGNTDALQVRCADGTCVESAGQCPVLQPCDEFRCSDGTCRLSEDECPEAGGCPSWARVRCCDGSCAVSPTACLATEDSSGECRIGSGCPDGQSRCPINGQCVTKVSSCPDVAEPSNGCAPELPVKCPNSGECVTSADVCPLANGCSSATPKLCSNGQCVTLDATCASDGACPAGQQCEISGRCGVDCRTTRHCPYDAPLRCANGECAAACNATIVCTAAAPVLCADGECVPHQRLCRPMHNCPVSAPILCADKRSCQVTAEACDAVEVECPASRPLLCKSGACVSSAVECPEREMPCEVAGEVRCFDGLCRASYHLCQLAQDLGGKTSAVATPVARDMSAVCEAGEFLCPAGECVADRRECSLVEACPWSLPYSCADGTCRESADTCPEVVECADVGATRCDDGSCRTGECPLSNRCGAGTTRCGADGTCRTSCVGATGEGGEWFREVNVLAQTFAVDRNEDTELPVAFDSRGVVRARLMVPSGAVKGAGGTAQVATFPVKVWPVSVSELRATTTTVHSTRRADYGGRSSLPFDEGVLSPAFRCEIGGELSFALTYSAFADKINNELEPVKYADVCLAQLDAASTRWSCVRSAYEDRVSETVYSVDPEDEEVRSGALARHYLSSFLGSCDGTTAYAFVQEPLRTPPVPEAAAAASYFERHKTAIIAGVTSAAVISLVMMYVFWRLYRYRIKYKQKQKEEVELQSRKDFIEENAGGLGVAGDGIDMMVNPMVVQMQDLSEQLERVQQELGIQEANDTGKLDTLEHERNNIKAEMAEVQRQLDLENMRHEQSGTRPLRQGSGRSALTSSRSGNVPTSSSVDEFANTPVPRTQSSGRRSRGFGPAKAKKKTFS